MPVLRATTAVAPYSALKAERLRGYRALLDVHARLDRGVERPFDSTVWQTDPEVTI
jgi:hypothetical protein